MTATPLPWTQLFLYWLVAPAFALTFFYFSLKTFGFALDIKRTTNWKDTDPPKGLLIFIVLIFAFALLTGSVALTETAASYKPVVEVPKVKIVTPR